MSCNCEGKTINIGMGCCQEVLGPVQNYYTKWETERYVSGYTYSKEEIDEKTSGKTSGCCITPEEVDEKIASAKTEIEQEIPSLSGYATEEWVLDQQYITGVDLSNYALKSEIPTVPTSNTAFTNDAGYLTEHQSLSGYATEAFVSGYTYDKATIDYKISEGGTFDPTQYYTTANTYNKTEVNNLLNDKLDATAYTPTDLSNYYTKSETSSKTEIDTAIADKVSQSDFQTYSGTVASELSGKASQSLVNTLSGVVTSHTSNNDIHVTSTDKTNWNNKSDFSGSYNDLTDKPTIPSIWSGSEAQWAQISGGTLDNNCIYLVF